MFINFIHSSYLIKRLLKASRNPYQSRGSVGGYLSYCLHVTEEKGVKSIVFDIPHKKNAFTTEMYNDMKRELYHANFDPNIHVVLLTGNGDFYSAGNDISKFEQLINNGIALPGENDQLKEFIDIFIALKKPIISAVNGPAIGIAATTLGLCDRVFISKNAYLWTPFANLGLSPEGCASYTFPKLMGSDVANDMLYKNRKISAQEALQYGLVHEIYDSPKTVLDSATKYCRDLAELPVAIRTSHRFTMHEDLVTILKEVNRNECAELQRRMESVENIENMKTYILSLSAKKK